MGYFTSSRVWEGSNATDTTNHRLFVVLFFINCSKQQIGRTIKNQTTHRSINSPPVEVVIEKPSTKIRGWTTCLLPQDHGKGPFFSFSYKGEERRTNYVFRCGEDSLKSCYDTPLEIVIEDNDFIFGGRAEFAPNNHIRIYFSRVTAFSPPQEIEYRIKFYTRCKSN